MKSSLLPRHTRFQDSVSRASPTLPTLELCSTTACDCFSEAYTVHCRDTPPPPLRARLSNLDLMPAPAHIAYDEGNSLTLCDSCVKEGPYRKLFHFGLGLCQQVALG